MPIFKYGSKLLVNYYRSISLLPSLSEILEKLIKSRVLKFFGEHDVIYDYQYGFRNNQSVVHALLDVTSRLGQIGQSFLIFLELSRKL